MTLALDDPLWDSVSDCYGDSSELRGWLQDIYDQGSLSDERLGEIINAIQHQGDSSEAMYAVAPHLIELAKRFELPMNLALLSHAGWVYACAERDGYADCLDEIEDDFRAAAKTGMLLIAPLIAEAGSFAEFQWGVAGLAGFLGHDRFARLLGNLDLYEGEFHYMLLDHTIPIDP